MGNYCLYVDGELKHAGLLPKSDKNVSGLNHLSDEDLRPHNWYPMKEVKVPFNNKTHYLKQPTIELKDNKVVFTDTVVAFTAEEIKQNNWNDWFNEMRNSDITDMKRDMECHIKEEHGGVVADSVLQEKYDRKIAKRATKPPQP